MAWIETRLGSAEGLCKHHCLLLFVVILLLNWRKLTTGFLAVLLTEFYSSSTTTCLVDLCFFCYLNSLIYSLTYKHFNYSAFKLISLYKFLKTNH